MLAVEFKADFENGVIKVPKKYQGSLSKHLKVIALMDDRVNSDNVPVISDEYIEKH